MWFGCEQPFLWGERCMASQKTAAEETKEQWAFYEQYPRKDDIFHCHFQVTSPGFYLNMQKGSLLPLAFGCKQVFIYFFAAGLCPLNLIEGHLAHNIFKVKSSFCLWPVTCHNCTGDWVMTIAQCHNSSSWLANFFVESLQEEVGKEISMEKIGTKL